MTTHTCPRCGLESQCSRNSWPDRHPTATVVGVTLISVFALVVVVGYPWLLLVGAVGAGVWLVDRERRRRHALAARADWEFRRLMEQPVPKPVAPRRRGADHWAPTRPFRRRRND